MLVSNFIKYIDYVKFNIEEDKVISSAHLDSRLIEEGSIFFGTKGLTLDGNDYADEAIKKGAVLVIIDNPLIYENINGNKVLVSDTLKALREIGVARIKDFKGIKVAITGSFGKTTTKDMLKDILSIKYKVHSNIGNKNNELGVSLTVAGISEGTEVLITEFGSNSSGEIEKLFNIVKPNIAIVTSVGHAHIGKFNSIKDIIKEKLSIINLLPKDSIGIVPYELKKYVTSNCDLMTFGTDEKADIYIRALKHEGSKILYKTNIDNTEYVLNHPYIHVVLNSLVGIVIGNRLGIDKCGKQSVLERFTPSQGRGLLKVVGDITIIDDTYNAGLESVIKAVESLSLMNKSPKYAVIGEIAEAEGYEYEIYSKIVGLSKIYQDINFIFIGESYTNFIMEGNSKIFSSHFDGIEEIKLLTSGVVVIKASRSKKFEDFVKIITDKEVDIKGAF